MEEDYYYDIAADPSMYSGEADAAAAAALGGAMCVIWVIALVVSVLMMIGLWKIFVKAGKPGWAAVVPIYNIIILLEIISKPVWWVVLFLVPVVSLVGMILTSLELAKVFGKGTGFAVGLILFPYIFYPMLGFGNAKYQGASAGSVPVDGVKVAETAPSAPPVSPV